MFVAVTFSLLILVPQVVSTPYKAPTPTHDDELVYASVHSVKRGNQVSILTSELVCVTLQGGFIRDLIRNPRDSVEKSFPETEHLFRAFIVS